MAQIELEKHYSTASTLRSQMVKFLGEGLVDLEIPYLINGPKEEELRLPNTLRYSPPHNAYFSLFLLSFITLTCLQQMSLEKIMFQYFSWGWNFQVSTFRGNFPLCCLQQWLCLPLWRFFCFTNLGIHESSSGFCLMHSQTFCWKGNN